jgi:hypothetical protein
VRGVKPKNIVLAGLVGLAVLLSQRQCRIEAMHERGAIRRETIEAAGLDQRFEHAPIDLRQVQAPAQIFEARVVAVRAALIDDGRHRALAHAFDGAEPVTNRSIVDHREFVRRQVHVRRQNRQAHFLAAVVQHAHDLVGVVHVRRQHRGHVRRGLVGFQPPGLV